MKRGFLMMAFVLLWAIASGQEPASNGTVEGPGAGGKIMPSVDSARRDRAKEEAQQVRDFIANTRATRAGSLAPDFTLADMNGNEVTLSAFRGKYVLIDFWGSWCGFCRQSHPALLELHAALQSKGASVEFISIATSEQNDENWRKAIEEDKLAWIQLNDAHSGKSKSIQTQYAVGGVPHSLLISPEGKIIYREHPVEIIPKIKELFKL
jgi:thiol-disulfide isomerase/thioredoxin